MTWSGSVDPLWIGLIHLLSSEWFTRFWTFQEGIVSKEAVMLGQDSCVDFDKLLDLVCWALFNKDGVPYYGQKAFNLAR